MSFSPLYVIKTDIFYSKNYKKKYKKKEKWLCSGFVTRYKKKEGWSVGNVFILNFT